MAYKALYRKWRPVTFDQVIEQSHVTQTLRRSVITGRISHAYLFCGTRGTGKTTLAHILSRSVNCLQPKDGNPCNQCSICKGILSGTLLDVIEIDAASNNSVENVRNIRDEVAYSPSEAKYKVYIIDEVHMLSSGAFNALLKTLEEPPSHVIFILATTEPNKLPATILSRCQRYDFHRISIDGMVSMLNRIINDMDVDLEKNAARMIARIADGALRDAISLLDQCISMVQNTIAVQDVLTCAGILDDDTLFKMVDAIYEKNIEKVLHITDDILVQGKNPTQLLSDLIIHYRDLLICMNADSPQEYVAYTEEALERLVQQSKEYDLNMIMFIIKELSIAENTIKRISQPKAYLEIILINLCHTTFSYPEQASLLERISLLEKKITQLKNPSTLEKVPSSVQSQSRQKISPPKEPEQRNHQQKKVKDEKSNGSSSFEWNKVLQYFEDQKAMDIFPYLSDTKAELNDHTLYITFKSQLFKEMIFKDRNNIKSIKNAIEKLFGFQCEVELKDDAFHSNPHETNDFEKNLEKAAQELGVNVEYE